MVLTLTLTLTLETQIPQKCSNRQGDLSSREREEELPEDIALLVQENKKNTNGGQEPRSPRAA